MTAWHSLVHPGDLVFDVGAGDGERTRTLLARGARVVCVEAHPERARRLRQELAAAVVVVDMGLANRTGRLATGHGSSIEVTTLDEMIRSFGAPRYVRLDVGGDPESILDGLSPGSTGPTPVPLLSFEFKAAGLTHVRRALERLVRLGYQRFNWRRAPGDQLMAAAWLDSGALLEQLERLVAEAVAGAGAAAGALSIRGDIFARSAQTLPCAPERYAVSILRQPGNIHSECFRELAETVTGGLNALGHEAVLSEEQDTSASGGRRNIVFGSNLIANLDAPPAFAPGSILYNLEQIYDGSPWLTPGLLAAFRAHTVWDYSQANIQALARYGIPAQHVPVGYLPSLTRIPPAPAQDIDVLFIGSLAARRLAVLQALERSGLRVMAIYGRYGPERDQFIARAKMILNIHFHEAKVFEIVRVSYLLANRCFVVSETGLDAATEAAFSGGVAFAPYDRLVPICLSYLREPAARQAVAARGFAIMSAIGEADMLRPVVGDARGP